MAVTQTFAVEGMSCEHCVGAVTAELRKVAGVTAVTVDLARGVATVESGHGVDRAAVVAAVDEAGYEVGS